MDRAIQKLTAAKFDVYGIGHIANVVDGVVTGMPVHALRLLETARSLLLRLTWRTAAGQPAGSPCCPRPADASATWSPEPARSGMARLRLEQRLGSPGSAIQFGRF